MSNKGQNRRLSGNPLTYDVSVPPPHRPLPAPAFREGYGPNHWHPEREFFPGTPSPERFRPPQVEPWPRPPSWQEPEPLNWAPVHDPYVPQWNRAAAPAREVASTRMFEPSDTWKQTHHGPMPYPESVAPRERPLERFPEPVVRNFRRGRVDRSRPRDAYSPNQPAGERYRPYSPPPPSAARNRVPYTNPGTDNLNFRPPSPEAEWAPEDDDLYADRPDSSSRVAPPTTRSIRSDSLDRSEKRFRGRDGFERSVTPISPQPSHHSSPGYVSAVASMPKRESPDLPHLQALPPKQQPSQPVRIPLGPDQHPSLPPKPMVSRSPSHSSTASSTHLPHVSNQTIPKGLPAKPQVWAEFRPSLSTVPARAQTKSPALQISAVNQASQGGSDAVVSTSSNEHAPVVQPPAVAPPSHSPSIAAQSRRIVDTLPERPIQANSRWNGGRLAYTQRAPSFVPSTLAIDAKLKFPEVDLAASGTHASGSSPKAPRDSKHTDLRERRNEAESDMEMSAPASPVKSLREREDFRQPDRLAAPPPQAETSIHVDLPSEFVPGLRGVTGVHPSDTERGRVSSEDIENAADTSDMEMSPPASPVLAPASLSSPTGPSQPLGQGARDEKMEIARPALSIDTSLASPQVDRPAHRKRASRSSIASTPQPGDDSDMDMSSPTSSVAPSPPASPVPAGHGVSKPSPQRSPSQPPREPTSIVVVAPSAIATQPVEPSSLPTPAHRDVAISPLVTPASLPARPSVVTDCSVLQTTVQTRRLPSIASSTHSRPEAATLRQHVEAGELSPPVSEETLREETEGIEKDPDVVMHAETTEKAPPAISQEAPPTDHAVVDTDKALTDIPLADALRMVVRLRMLFPRQSPEERVDPIILSNRHIAEPEEPNPPAPEVVIGSVTEKEHDQMSRGKYDGTKHSLRKRFADHQAALTGKVERLRKEYMELHERWLVQCAKLDEVARANALEEAAATAGRTTRRSAAMGDAVRTDLEMEQILASLGNEELTDANHLSAKNAATIPDMISVMKGRVEYKFDDTNNLVEDPHSFYALETGIDDWSDEEKKIFVEKYAMHPKQFGIIADFLPNKTPSQCVTFYYLHKNTTIDFRKAVADFNTVGKRTRRGRGGKQKGNALLADILKHDDEVSRGVAPNTTSSRRRRGVPPAPTPTPSSTPFPSSASGLGLEPEAGPSTAPPVEQLKRTGSRRGTSQNTPTATPTPDPEPAPKRPRRRANPSAKAAAAMAQDEGEEVAVGINPPATTSTRSPAIQDEDARPAKRARRGRKSKVVETETLSTPVTAEPPAALAMPAETKPVSQTDATAKKKGAGAYWSDEDKALFIKMLAQHGDDFKRIAASMPNKTTIQVASFYKAKFNEMQLAKVAALAPKRSPTPSGSRIGKSSSLLTPTTEGGVATEADLHSQSDSGAAMSEDNGSSPSSASVAALLTAVSPSGTPLSSRTSEGPVGNGTPSGEGVSAIPPAPLTTLPSPPNPNSGQPHPSLFARLTAPRLAGATGAPSTPEFSDFVMQPWMSGLGGNGSQIPGLPATLETTEDLVRYLEHRTRLTAGQNNDSDFM
ncbi:hypothetical protein C8Q78DRAFT_996704 [Trametes maxima]|nr:hypothetical protein C8Q78DRAFT_996704 [Trametes maxima]